MIRTLAIAAIFLVFSPTTVSKSYHEKHIVTPRPSLQQTEEKDKEPHWNTGTVTVYADYFEGRPMANGKTFRHRDRVVACRGGQLNRKVEIRYGQNGKSTVVVCDRGRLPLHREDCWQFDVTKTVARDLGLYRLTKDGRTDRKISWRYVD